jgi:hypothetical protein
LEIIARTVRGVTSIAMTGTSSNIVVLTTTANAVSTTTRFYLSNGQLKEDVNNTYFGPLNAPNATITSVLFSLISTTTSQGLKVDITVSGQSGSSVVNKNFHTTVVAKGS